LSCEQDNKTTIAIYTGANLTNLELSLTDITNFKILSDATLFDKEFKTAHLQQKFNGIPVSGTSATVLIKEREILKFNHVFVADICTKITGQTRTLKCKRCD
jgi:Zn-dependent metalloprotease